jgi:putative RNA 2'-phosphotransferase
MESSLVKLSRFLSLVLRHRPETIGLTLDPNGWAKVDELLEHANRAGHRITRPLLDRVVAENDKRRFAFSEDGRRMRASQGHSIEIDLELTPSEPPETLYHGTVNRFLESIRAVGLRPGDRQYVHLSRDLETATQVGRRRGRPVILAIRAREMHAAGMAFCLSANGVWLTERVPAPFIQFPESR